VDDEALGDYAEWVLRRIGNEMSLLAGIQPAPSSGPVDGKATSQAESARAAVDHLKLAGGKGIMHHAPLCFAEGGFPFLIGLCS
jgi:hypothetical protein